LTKESPSIDVSPANDAGPSGAEVKVFLIADVRGYTRFTQERGDEAAARLAARFADVSREGVEGAGGSVIELRGDEALAVFGSPRQALRAAVELQGRFVEESSAEPNLPLPVGIGLDAGEAVPVEGGYRGAPLNVAARLCAMAAPGEILATQEVVHLARRVDGVRFLDQGPSRLKGISHPVHVVRVVVETANPYKGLRAFEEADAPDFFGREALTQQIMARLAEAGERSRFLAVVGPSGSGKSSVVKAGVVPALRRGALPGARRNLVAEMVPGGQPVKELTAALELLAETDSPALEELHRGRGDLLSPVDQVLPDDAELVLVIDQFEEVFTLVEDEPVRARFLDLVENAVRAPDSRLRVILTMRADFYDRPLLYKRFGDLVGARTQTVTPLSAEELERAISGPAERAGVALEPGLVAQMISDVGGEPGALPLLQYALTELFEQRRGSTMTLEAYRAIGGVSGALARRADSVFEGLDDDQREAARQLYLRLTTAVEETELARRRVPRSELLSVDVGSTAMESAIEAFGAARLLSFDRDPATGSPTVEVAHEALLREWGRLRGWLDAAHEDLRTQRRLAVAAREWVDADRDPSFLATGSRLAAFDTWRQGSGLAITPQEREFLEASLAERDRRRAEEEGREARERELERRSLRRLRTVVAVLAVAALIAAALTVFAFTQRGRAEREERVAVARELAAAAVANLDVDPERSILLALEAVDRTRSVDGSVLPEAEEALHRAVIASRIELSVAGVGGALDWSPEGVFVTEGPEDTGMIDIRDAATGERVLQYKGHDIDVNDVAFSPDGSMLTTTGDDGALKVWDPETGDLISSVTGEGSVWGPAFTSDGTLVAASWPEEGTVRIADPTTGRVIRTVEGLAMPFKTAFSPDGNRLVVGQNESKYALVFDVTTGETVHVLGGHQYPVNGVSWSPDGRWIATAANDASVRVWDARTGTTTFELLGHTGVATSADWSPDSRRLVTGGSDGTAIVWEIEEDGTRELLSLSALETSSGVLAAFSPDGTRVMTGDMAITSVKIWDVSISGDAEVANVPTEFLVPVDVTYLPNGRIVAPLEQGSAAIWEIPSGTQDRLLGPGQGSPEPVWALEASPDGTRVATVRNFAAIVDVWDPASGGRVFAAVGRGGQEVSTIAWSDDGAHLAVATRDGDATIFDRTGNEVRALEMEHGFIDSATFSPDGRLLATSVGHFERPLQAHLTLWEWESGEVVRRIRQPSGVGAIAFDPTGALIAAVRGDGAVEVYDVDSGESRNRLPSTGSPVDDLEFSPDGSQIATGSDDGTVRLFDAESGTQRLVLRGHDYLVSGVAFSPDGTTLASASPDALVRVWALELDDLIRIAEGELTRELTEGECRQYLHEPCPA
jgi:WD40 repeat protein/class 3 adenylate cyclase